MLTLETNGIGTISPNYRGVSLLVGNNYKVTATAAKGFSFAGWTGSSATNSATLKFVMASNLTFTANFQDVTKPTLTIAAPTARERWSNTLFTAKGTAADNWHIASIQYQVNGGDWTNATGTTNWTAQVDLVPGTKYDRGLRGGHQRQPFGDQKYDSRLCGHQSTNNQRHRLGNNLTQLQQRIVGTGTELYHKDGACQRIRLHKLGDFDQLAGRSDAKQFDCAI